MALLGRENGRFSQASEMVGFGRLLRDHILPAKKSRAVGRPASSVGRRVARRRAGVRAVRRCPLRSRVRRAGASMSAAGACPSRRRSGVRAVA